MRRIIPAALALCLVSVAERAEAHSGLDCRPLLLSPASELATSDRLADRR